MQHAKARPCSPWMPTPPTVACMLVPDWHRNRASVKGLPTDDTQHTEDMDLCRGVTQPTNKQLYSVASVEGQNYLFCIHLLNKLYSRMPGLTENDSSCFSIFGMTLKYESFKKQFKGRTDKTFKWLMSFVSSGICCMYFCQLIASAGS